MPLVHHSYPPIIPPVRAEKVSADLQERLQKAGINSFPIPVLITLSEELTAERTRTLCHFGLRPNQSSKAKADGVLYMSGMNMLGSITALPYIRYLESLPKV